MRAIFALLGLSAFGSIAVAGCNDDEDSLTYVSGGTSSESAGGKGGADGEAGKGASTSGGKGGSSNAGSTGTGGSGTGGSGTGGSGTGGSGTGGSGTGGSDSGGSDNGGAGAGGADSGGAGAGGADSGGAGAGAEGGAGGSGGAGGTDTTGGTGGTAGSGGSGGTAGTAGTAGTGGSTGGTIGASGSAGEGGESGAGATSGTSGTSGTAGTGATIPPTANACGYGCVDDGDCDVAHLIFCDTNLGRCKEADLGCETHADCVPFASAWIGDCTADDDCPYYDFGDVCVSFQGGGRCASTPIGVDCIFGGVPTVLQHFSPTEDITVCVNSSGRCENNTCFIGCTDDPDFCTDGSTGFGPVCDSVSGRCGGCTDDDECDGSGVSHCNLATGFCECADAGDCVGLPGRDACVNGACGCSGTSVCTAIASPAATFCE